MPSSQKSTISKASCSWKTLTKVSSTLKASSAGFEWGLYPEALFYTSRWEQWPILRATLPLLLQGLLEDFQVKAITDTELRDLTDGCWKKRAQRKIRSCSRFRDSLARVALRELRLMCGPNFAATSITWIEFLSATGKTTTNTYLAPALSIVRMRS